MPRIRPLSDAVAGDAVRRMQQQGAAADAQRHVIQMNKDSVVQPSEIGEISDLHRRVLGDKAYVPWADRTRRDIKFMRRHQLEFPPIIKSFKKGGKVKKTGLYQLHKDEEVIPAHKKSKIKLTIKK